MTCAPAEAPLARHASAFAGFVEVTSEGVAALASGLGVALPEGPPPVALAGLIEAVKGVDAVRSTVDRPMTPAEWGLRVFGLHGDAGHAAAGGLMRALAVGASRRGGFGPRAPPPTYAPVLPQPHRAVGLRRPGLHRVRERPRRRPEARWQALRPPQAAV